MLLSLENFETDNKFLVIEATCRTLARTNLWFGLSVEPIECKVRV